MILNSKSNYRVFKTFIVKTFLLINNNHKLHLEKISTCKCKYYGLNFISNLGGYLNGDLITIFKERTNPSR